MRQLRLILALSVAVTAVSPAPLMARQSAPTVSAASADAMTCMGAYGALGKLRDNLAVTNPDLKDIPNFSGVDFSARKVELQRRTAFDAAQVNANESAAITLLTSGVINSDPASIQRVLDTVARCDAVFGFRPQLGQVQGGTSAPAEPPEPSPLTIRSTPAAPTPPPQPAAAPPPAALPPSATDDRSCAIAYLALSWGNGANPTLAKALLDRALTSGGKYMASNPKLAVPDVQADIQTAAKARLDPIVTGAAGPESLFADVHACDTKYGYGVPEGVKP